MNKRDLKRLKIDSSFIISPERFISMFGIECDNISKINIHDLHYILGKNLNHAGVNQIDLDKIYTGEILLIGTINNFKAYYRPIRYRIKINNTIEEKVKTPEEPEKSVINTTLSELCYLYSSATDIQDLDRYLNEIYERSNFNLDDELESNRSKIYSFPARTRRH